MPMRSWSILLIFSIVILSLQTSCKKDELLTDAGARLEFSDDTLLFDTVFATIGSATKNLRIYNTYDQPLKISSIRLAGGPQSNFRINVNGVAGTEFSDVEIRAGDSIWVFAEVTVDPNQLTLPYIIKDSIVLVTNGNSQDIDLVAWGQNAHFIVANKSLGTGSSALKYALLDTNLNAQITWDNTLPYVVYGGYAVIDSTQTLTIQAGTQIHFSSNAGLWVYKGGKLKVQGSAAAPVVFQGLRREQAYQDEPGQWDRIWINDGAVNEIDYAIIKNGFIGIQTEVLSSPAMAQKLNLSNTIIRNMSGFGIFSRNSDITAWNCLIENCGQYCAALTIGGKYDFTHCTLANYWRFSQRGTPALYLNNYFTDNNDNNIPVDLDSASFRNCIIYGNNDYELEADMISGADSLYKFRNVLMKSDNKHPVTNSNFIQIKLNQDPLFEDNSKHLFGLKANSPAIDAGDVNFATGNTATDITGKARGSNPDLGTYER